MSKHKLLLLLLFFTFSLRLEAKILDRILVQVNHETITISDLAEYKQKLSQGGQQVEIPSAQNELLNLFIDEVLTKQLITKLNLSASDEEVTAHINSILKGQNTTKQELTVFLKERGMSFKTYQQDIREGIERQRLLEREIKSAISISDEDLRGHYYNTYKRGPQKKSYHIRQIFFPAESEALKKESFKKAKKAYKEYTKGASFKKLVKKYTGSDDVGDLGFVEESDLIAPFKKALKKLKLNDLSKPFSTHAGVHMIQLLKAKRLGTKSFKDAKGEIHQKIYAERFQAVLKQWIKEKREEAFIEKLSTIHK